MKKKFMMWATGLSVFTSLFTSGASFGKDTVYGGGVPTGTSPVMSDPHPVGATNEYFYVYCYISQCSCQVRSPGKPFDLKWPELQTCGQQYNKRPDPQGCLPFCNSFCSEQCKKNANAPVEPAPAPLPAKPNKNVLPKAPGK